MNTSRLSLVACAVLSAIASVGALTQFLETLPAVDNLLVRAGLVAFAVLMGCVAVVSGSIALDRRDIAPPPARHVAIRSAS